MFSTQILSKLRQKYPIDSATVSTLYTLSQKSLTSATIFTILITVFLYSELSYSIVLWATIVIGLLLFRLYQTYLFKKDSQLHSMDQWYKKFMLFAFITAIVVSSLSFLFIPYLDQYHQLFILASLLGLTAGATTSLSSDMHIAIAYISIIMIPLILTMMKINTSLSFILAILMILFYLSQVIMIRKSYAQSQKIKELEVQKNLLHNVFSEAPIGMFTYDEKLNILDANKHLHKIFAPQEPIRGMNLHTFTNSHLLGTYNNVLTQGSQSYSGDYVANNGSQFWIETRAFPFKSIDNNILGGVGIIEDKTQEHIDKKELESLYEKLQNQIEHNQFLLDENKQFIADMVHQIRTPLSVIMTNTSLLEMKSDLNVSSYITQIHSAINMLSNSYEDLSYIITNDTIEYKPIEINLTDFLNERIDFFDVIAQANDKTITTDVENDITVTMNDIELERLIDNNLSNAIKHSSEKSDIKIVLKKNDSEIILQFITQGETIKDLSKLFDKNYTESHHAKRSLGLGLHMVKTICEKNCTDYHVHSQDGINIFTYIFKV